jgi:hypothetical protein
MKKRRELADLDRAQARHTLRALRTWAEEKLVTGPSPG